MASATKLPFNNFSEPLVRFDQVSVWLTGQKKILEEVSFSVFRGETLVLLGRSGSGKTSTLKLINRLIEPTGGEIRIDGRQISDIDVIHLRRRIGYVIQEVGLFPHFDIERNVGLVPRLEKWPEDRVQERVRAVLSLVGLDPAEYLHRIPQELSGGQRQRVGIARALAADPELLLMDEPFGALDPLTRAELQKEFLTLSQKLKKTVLFVTHDVREAFLLASRIGLFRGGHLIEVSTPAEFSRSLNSEAQAFVRSMLTGPANPVS